MSEQTTNYMAELDAWIEETVMKPLYAAARYNSEDWSQESPSETRAKVREAIREKVRESYHNGLKAGGSCRWKENDPHQAVDEAMQRGLDERAIRGLR